MRDAFSDESCGNESGILMADHSYDALQNPSIERMRPDEAEGAVESERGR